MIKYKCKLVLWKSDPNAQGEVPIYVRVRVNGVRRLIATGIFVMKEDWDPADQQVLKSNRMAAQHNADITLKRQAVVDYILQHQIQKRSLTADHVKAHFSAGRNLHNIFEFIDEYIDNMKHKRQPGTLHNYGKYSRKLELFHGSRLLSFEEIDIAYLQRYEDSLRDEGLDGNYIHANFKMLKTFFNAAKRRQIITCYPFGNYENPEYTQKDKDHLSMAELAKWEEYADGATNPVLKQTAVYFLLGCYTGLRISDWFRFDQKKHVHQGRLLLRAKKNGEWVTMPISKPMERNLVRMEALPLTISEPEINRSLKDIAKATKTKKRITSHGGRGTFAVTICAEHGIGLEVCAELLGITVATCARSYYRTTNAKIDKECREAWSTL